MGKVIDAVLGVVEIAAGAVLDFYGYGIGNGLIAAGVAQLINSAIVLLTSPHRPPVSPTDVNYSGTLEPRRIIYGMQKVGGVGVIPP